MDFGRGIGAGRSRRVGRSGTETTLSSDDCSIGGLRMSGPMGASFA
jgi:hypothetical protein